MALAIGAANVPSIDNWLNTGVAPRFDETSYPTVHARQNSSTTSNDTVNMFIDGASSEFEYGASIVEACADQTIYAIQCTSAPSYYGLETCGPNGAVVTVTVAETRYASSSAVTTSVYGTAVDATLQESCSLAGTTQAACTATVKGEVDGTSASSTVTSTLTGNDYYRYDVSITAGAEKTASATTTCATGAASSLKSKKTMVWALMGVICVGGIQAIV